MQNRMRVAVLMVCLAMLGGVDMVAAESSTAAGGAEVGEKVDEAFAAIKSYGIAQKDEAVKKAKVALDALDKRIDELEKSMKSEGRKMDRAARQSAEATLSKLRAQRAELAKRYDKFSASSAAAWEQVKQGLIESYDALRDSLSKAQAEF